MANKLKVAGSNPGSSIFLLIFIGFYRCFNAKNWPD